MMKENDDDIAKIRLRNLTARADTNYLLWKVLRPISNGILHRPQLKTQDNKWARSDAERVKTLADYFEECFTSNNPTRSITINHTEITNSPQPFAKVTLQEVKKLIKELDNKKGCGYDQLDAKLLKELPINAIQYLRKIWVLDRLSGCG